MIETRHIGQDYTGCATDKVTTDCAPIGPKLVQRRFPKYRSQVKPVHRPKEGLCTEAGNSKEKGSKLRYKLRQKRI